VEDELKEAFELKEQKHQQLRAEFETRLQRYHLEAFFQTERRELLDDRFFRSIATATQLCTNARLLAIREQYAEGVVSEPIEDLSALAAEVEFEEQFTDRIDSELGPDVSEEEQKVFEQERDAVEELILANSGRRTAIVLEREKIRQQMLFKPKPIPRVAQGSLFVEPVEERERKEVGVTSECFDRVSEKFAQVEETMVEVDRRSQEDERGRIEQEDKYNQQLHRIQELIPLVAEAEKHEFLCSELSASLRALRVDRDELAERVQILKDGKAAAEAKTQAALRPAAAHEARLAEYNERVAKVAQRKERLGPEEEALAATTAAYEEKLRQVDQLYSEVVKKGAQTRSVEDLATRMAEELYGSKQIFNAQESSLAKVEMLKKNLAQIALDNRVGMEEEEEEEEARSSV
jgi:hypothetical protein